VNRPTVVLCGASAQRVVGLPVHERNRRAAERAGARVAENDVPSGAEWVLLVPSSVAIEQRLISELQAMPRPTRLRVGSQVLVWAPAAETGSDLPEGPAPPGSASDASSPGAAREATRELLLRTGKASDGPVSRAINRPLSRLFSSLFLKLGLAPIHASIVNLAIGLASAWLAAQPGWLPLAGSGFLFQMASMFDGVDGEMARATLRDSRLGGIIDSSIDHFTFLACTGALVVGWVREGMDRFDVLLGASVLVALPVTLLQVLYFTRRHSDQVSLAFFTSCVYRAAERSRSRSLRLASWFFPAVRRDVLALIMMCLTLTGSRESIAAGVILGCVAATYVLIAHRRALIEAAAVGAR
jgi:CDP-L-myo-inositol myo-inositolphosphotransferase